MTRLPLVVLPGALLVTLATAPAVAQDPLPPAHVAHVEGEAVLEHGTTAETLEPNVPLDAGDRVSTKRGRAEVLFGDGSLLHLDEHTAIDVLSDSRVRQFAGRIAVIAGSARSGRLQIDTPAGSVLITSPGELRVGVFDEGRGPEVELAVIRGSAELSNDRGAVSLGAGMRSVARQGEAPYQPVPFNAARLDAFDQWSLDRLAARRGAASAPYVPASLQTYGTVFDTYGTWNHEPSYGYVWFPRVAAGWRPYYHGRWRFYGRFGWTWVGGHPWTYPTHHYGRWGLTSVGAWFWIPGPTWGPAWVHWAVAPGYVSWCPLGYRGGPVIGFGYSYASRSLHRHDPWSAWTVVRRDHFGGRRHVSGVAVDGRRFAPEAVRPFVMRTALPARTYAVARGGAADPPRTGPTAGGDPARGAVSAVPRGSVPAAAASSTWGRDMRWKTAKAADDPAAVRRGAGTVATVQGRPASAPQPGVAAPRGAPGTRTPASEPPSRTTRPGWTPDSVPVYRGGVISGAPAGARAIPRAYDSARPGRRPAGPSPSSPSAVSPYSSAVPRAGSPSYPSTAPAPRSYPPPAPAARPDARRPYGSRPPTPGPPVYRPPAASSMPGVRAPAQHGGGPWAAPAPPPGARQAPAGGGGVRHAAPRGGAQPQAGAPPGGRRSSRR